MSGSFHGVPLGVISDGEIREFTLRVNSLVIGADSVGEMYGKLGRLARNGSSNWQLLRSPSWVGGRLIAVVLKPDLGQGGGRVVS